MLQLGLGLGLGTGNEYCMPFFFFFSYLKCDVMLFIRDCLHGSLPATLKSMLYSKSFSILACCWLSQFQGGSSQRTKQQDIFPRQVSKHSG